MFGLRGNRWIGAILLLTAANLLWAGQAIAASASIYLLPLFGVALTFGILGERLSPRAVVGPSVVLLATLVLFRHDFVGESRGSPTGCDRPRHQVHV